MLWARLEGKVSMDGARALERRPWGRAPLLQQTLWIINECQIRVLGSVLSGFSERTMKPIRCPLRGHCWEKVYRPCKSFWHSRIAGYECIRFLWLLHQTGVSERMCGRQMQRCWPGVSNLTRCTCRKHGHGSLPHSCVTANIDSGVNLQTCQGSKNSSGWSISINVHSVHIGSELGLKRITLGNSVLSGMLGPWLSWLENRQTPNLLLLQTDLDLLLASTASESRTCGKGSGCLNSVSSSNYKRSTVSTYLFIFGSFLTSPALFSFSFFLYWSVFSLILPPVRVPEITSDFSWKMFHMWGPFEIRQHFCNCNIWVHVAPMFFTLMD